MFRIISLILIILSFTTLAAQAQKLHSAVDYQNRGLERQGNGDLAGAIADYDKVIELRPRDEMA